MAPIAAAASSSPPASAELPAGRPLGEVDDVAEIGQRLDDRHARVLVLLPKRLSLTKAIEPDPEQAGVTGALRVDVEPVADVGDALGRQLEQLAGGVEDRGLGIITNADGDIQRRKLAALGLLERMPAFVASSEAGSAKPEPAIFHAACELLELPPERVAYVGDRLDIDAQGARDAGLLGIWVDRLGEAEALARSGEDPGVPVIESLDALASALRSISGTG